MPRCSWFFCTKASFLCVLHYILSQHSSFIWKYNDQVWVSGFMQSPDLKIRVTTCKVPENSHKVNKDNNNHHISVTHWTHIDRDTRYSSDPQCTPSLQYYQCLVECVPAEVALQHALKRSRWLPPSICNLLTAAMILQSLGTELCRQKYYQGYQARNRSLML
jgi:hypothetical protein